MATNVDYEFVGELQDELMCSICMKVLNKPQMVNCCEQRFCKNCLTKWMTYNKTCPHCRSTDFNHILLKRLSKRISELEVYCANKAHGCKSTLKVSEYQHHLSVDNAQGCFFTKLPCPIQCGADLFRGDLGSHCKVKCPKRRVRCRYCKSEGEYQMITGGHTDTCPCYPLACPQACGAKVLRNDLTAHQGVCPLEPVACPFSDIGCKVKVPRRDLDKHIQSSMFQHMTDMAKSHTALKQEYEALKKDYNALKEDHTALKENNRAKMNATGLFLKDRLSDRDKVASTITIAQLHTLLVDTSTIKMGSTLSLALSESNTASGHHYIILEGYKFKLNWQQHQKKSRCSRRRSQSKGRSQRTPQQQYLTCLYLVTDATYPVLPRDWSCVFKIYLNEKPQALDPYTSHRGSLPSAGVAASVEALGFVGGGGTAQIIVGGAQCLVGGGGAAQCLVGGGGASQGLVGGGGASQGLVGGGDQLLGSVILDYGGNITAPVLDIQTNVSEYLYNNPFYPKDIFLNETIVCLF